MCKGKATGRRLIAPAMLLLLILNLPNLLMADCAGDINRDGRVDGLDFAMLGKEMGRKDCFATPCKSDLNSDGAVDSRDKTILQSELGRRDCLAKAVKSPENGGSAPGAVADEEALPKKPPVELKGEVQDEIKIEVKEEAEEKTEEEKKEEAKEETKIVEDSDSRLFKKVKKRTPERVRFIDHGDGTVTDKETGLMWTSDADLPAEELLFYEALAYIEEMNRGNLTNFGYTDWRLPTLEELRSLKDFTDYTGDKKYFPPEGHPFENVRWMSCNTYYQWPTYFWATRLSWMVSAYCRLVGRNTTTCVGFLWPVRGGRKD
jgi:hypothetical protein